MGADKNKFFKCVSAFLGEGADAPWNISSLFPDLNDLGIAETVAEYFNEISQQYDPLDMKKIPHTFDIDLRALTHSEVLNLLKTSKKPSSTVPGDIFPESIPCNYENIVVPVRDIFNSIIRGLSLIHI